MKENESLDQVIERECDMIPLSFRESCVTDVHCGPLWAVSLLSQVWRGSHIKLIFQFLLIVLVFCRRPYLMNLSSLISLDGGGKLL